MRTQILKLSLLLILVLPVSAKCDEFPIQPIHSISKYPVSEFSFFYQPSESVLSQKLNANANPTNFKSTNTANYKTQLDYTFDDRFAIGAFIDLYNFNTKSNQFGSETLDNSSNQILTLAALMRYRPEFNFTDSNLFYTLLFTKDSLPAIESTNDNPNQLKVYIIKPTFWNLSATYQNLLTKNLDFSSFIQYGFAIDKPNLNTLKVTRVAHLVYGARIGYSLSERWRLHLGVEASDYFFDLQKNNEVRQTNFRNLAIKFGFSYELPQLLPDKPPVPVNLNSEFIPSI